MSRAGWAIRPAAMLLTAIAVSAAVQAESVQLAAAVSLGPALREAIETVREERSDLEPALHSGPSVHLLNQVRRGAPIDVLISASPREIDALVAEGLADGSTRRRLASNALVVVAPAARSAPADTVELATWRFGTIAVGNPRTAPLGRYTRQSLEALGLLATIEERFVFGESARHVAEYVARGEVDLAVVYRSDAQRLGERITLGAELPASSHDRVFYEGIVLRDAADARVAEAVLSELAAPAARASFARHGFGPPR